ncbi:aminotransferase class I/II-fold pyridoxal phosphate-dependent enzyme [Helicobacter sp. MIT 01-3238]|uniref:aminotransferase class I/II-fold pyridoxal phosphate-dependent enzyme n=1 Tax=Helicobacter sp. MIT 01-3238 TaxID=398627 RepID=UPI000E1F3650|nr:aminotransferase class I/II-fold pyridoxal phosphate-dependent enzyme [Helicobacter sp. MIT 01-3238]RDU52755.1 UDP-4-amino-4,6-dideoxy-N-acetyl-beta-L-altrosamine transaminase [Helicobacter sp. MIT 01-3238]
MPNQKSNIFLPYSTQLIDKRDIKRVKSALKSPLLTQGELCEEFEKKIAKYIGAKYALCFNSATSALYCAYRCAFKQGQSVITTPNSFVATANMLIACGCKPIFADILDDGNISVESIKSLLAKKITNTTGNNAKAQNIAGIVSVDFAGKSVEAKSIKSLAKAHNLAFVSDSSHAFGGELDGSKIGTFADVSIFSFHAIKPITTAEGGAIITNDKSIYERAKLLRSHGLSKISLWDSEVQDFGFNFRLNELQAALGLSQLEKIDEFLAKREKIAKIYDEAFCENPKFAKEYFTPTHAQNPPNIKSTNHLYPILLSNKLIPHKEAIFRALQARGLGVQVHYKPIFDYELFRDCTLDRQAKSQAGHKARHKAKWWYEAEISIPLHQAMSKKDIKYCIKSVLEVFKNAYR